MPNETNNNKIKYPILLYYIQAVIWAKAIIPLHTTFKWILIVILI